MKGRLPIGLRLTFWYMLIFALAQAVFGLGMWLILRHNLYDIGDDALEAQVEDFQRLLDSHSSDSAKQLTSEIQQTYGSKHAGEYLLVKDDQGTVLYRGPLADKAATLSTDRGPFPRYEDRGRGRIRFLTDSVAIHGQRYTVQVGVREDEVLGTLRVFRRYLFIFAPFLMLVAAGGGYWLSSKALAPVDLITRTARSITGQDLSSRLEKLETGDELQRLSDTLNEMLARIEAQVLRISQFTADASHELRTPIALIRTEAEITLRRPRNEIEYREALQHVLLEAEKTSALIETLLSLARSDHGPELAIEQPLDLSGLLRGSVERWRPIMAGKNLQLLDDLGVSSVFVAGDSRALISLFEILLDNASKYTPANGKVELTLRKTERSGVIEVVDSGIGISEEDQSKVFERFYRADKARSRESGGVGLGLSIAERIVQQHHGRITLKSNLGKGSTFTVELPLVVSAGLG
jgi:heavy metal sensor kinase